MKESNRGDKMVTLAACCLLAIIGFFAYPLLAQPRVNVPYLPNNVSPSRCAVLWFGEVDNQRNHVNVRVGYDDEKIVFHLHIFDRYLWYDTTPSPSDLTDWDTVKIFLDVGGDGGTLDSDCYSLEAQLNHWQERDAYQAAYQGDGSNWVTAALDFTSATVWRGNNLNQGTDSRGWAASLEVPFSGLGLSSSPASGTQWRLGLKVFDRDGSTGAVSEQQWPESMQAT